MRIQERPLKNVVCQTDEDSATDPRGKLPAALARRETDPRGRAGMADSNGASERPRLHSIWLPSPSTSSPRIRFPEPIKTVASGSLSSEQRRISFGIRPAGSDFTGSHKPQFSNNPGDAAETLPPRGLAAKLLLQGIRVYRMIRLVGPTCRFYPSCSRYAEEAIARKGARRGLCLSLGRLFRCHPFSRGGWDPVT